MKKRKPKKVLELEKKLIKKNIWFNITNNHLNQEAFNCWDAVSKRVRLGHSNIYIFSELKSKLAYFRCNNKINKMIIHCRGNQKIDFKKVSNIINKYKQCDEKIDVIFKYFKSKKGLVNPFIGFNDSTIIQIFDKSLLEEVTIPSTMMTNASHRRWGIEFKIQEIIDILPNVLIDDVILDATKFSLPKHKIGILTGNSPESGILLWKLVNKRIRKNMGKNLFFGDISFPEVIIESLPAMGLSMELDLRYKEVEKTVFTGVNNLYERGATIICIACNTTQYFSKKLQKEYLNKNILYINMPEVLYKYLKDKRIKEFDFFGINYVSDFNKWSAFTILTNSFKVHIPKKEDVYEINEIAFDVKKKGDTGEGIVKSINKLRNLINRATKTDNIVFALTELSILYDSYRKAFTKNSHKIYYDTLSIMAKYIGDIYTKDILEVIKKSKTIHKTSASEKINNFDLI